MIRIAVLTSGRQDWGILRSTCLLLRDDKRFDLRLLVGGLHHSPQFGSTQYLIEDDAFVPTEILDWVGVDEPAHSQAGRALSQIGDALARQECDALLIVGDRFETAAAAIAATVQATPIAHVHGGEVTTGAFDDALRHAISKLSHLHLVSHREHATRLLAMGEAPETVHVVGAPGLDNQWRSDLPGRADLERDLRSPLPPPVVLVTVQPTTLARGAVGGSAEVQAVVGAMDRIDATYVVTLPNSDPGWDVIRDSLDAAANGGGRRILVHALGDRRYWGMLKIADAMLGNSSSGIVEAPAFRLPVVNVGDRQGGRVRGANVIDVPDPNVEAVVDALRLALAPSTRARLAGSNSPYGDGHSAKKIVDVLASWRPQRRQRKAPVLATATLAPSG